MSKFDRSCDSARVVVGAGASVVNVVVCAHHDSLWTFWSEAGDYVLIAATVDRKLLFAHASTSHRELVRHILRSSIEIFGMRPVTWRINACQIFHVFLEPFRRNTRRGRGARD